MLFNSYEFLLFFLPATFIGFFLIARTSRHGAALWLATASLFFYGWWNPKFLLLLLPSIIFNYTIGYFIVRAANTQRAKYFLIAGILFDLGLLGYFKYINFLISTVDAITAYQWEIKDIVLPLGISFFTFTQIAFIVDAYRRIVKEFDFIHYLLFVTYFPHLIAGPVLHHKQMMPQFSEEKTYHINWDAIVGGIIIFTIGLSKKVLLADNFAVYANIVFDEAAHGVKPDFIAAWVGTLSYSLQLYFDFSGYTDMAIGLSSLFGVSLPQNFNSPYKAKSIIEFWQRWHMTLSQFLKDYLYIPLGGNRRGKFRRYCNLLTTMLIGGLWHGANWTFVIWGGIHGLYLVVNHMWRELKQVGFIRGTYSWWGDVFCVAMTFICVMMAWVVFRADNLESASMMLAGMANPSGLWPYFLGKRDAFFLLLGVSIIFLLPNSQAISIQVKQTLNKQYRSIAFGWGMGFVFAFAFLALQKKSEFLYFQF